MAGESWSWRGSAGCNGRLRWSGRRGACGGVRMGSRATTATAPADRVDPQRAITMHVVCWTLCEAIALYGLVIGIIAHRLEPVFFVWGFVALLLLHPRAENFGPS